MLKTAAERWFRFLFAVMLPFLLFFISYYGFESSYVKLKTMEAAPDFMFSSVYAYRVIPNFLMQEVFATLNYLVDHYFLSAKPFLLKHGSVFYHSIFIINAFFFVLSSLLLDKILVLNTLLKREVIRMMHLLGVFIMVIVQYVPTNCDSIALFFYLTGVLLTLQYYFTRKKMQLIYLCIIVGVSTFVRETACLNIAFFAALFIDFKNLKNSILAHGKEVVFLLLSFVVPYFVLKMIIPQEISFFEGIYWMKNFTSPFNILGLLFGGLLFYFIYHLGNREQVVILRRYIFFSVPYLVMITLVGLFWETRLFLPILISAAIIVSVNFKRHPTVL